MGDSGGLTEDREVIAITVSIRRKALKRLYDRNLPPLNQAIHSHGPLTAVSLKEAEP
jgi:hypothetical protein